MYSTQDEILGKSLPKARLKFDSSAQFKNAEMSAYLVESLDAEIFAEWSVVQFSAGILPTSAEKI